MRAERVMEILWSWDGPAPTTTEIARRLDVGVREAYQALQKMRELGRVESAPVAKGAPRVMAWRPVMYENGRRVHVKLPWPEGDVRYKRAYGRRAVSVSAAAYTIMTKAATRGLIKSISGKVEEMILAFGAEVGIEFTLEEARELTRQLVEKRKKDRLQKELEMKTHFTF